MRQGRPCSVGEGWGCWALRKGGSLGGIGTRAGQALGLLMLGLVGLVAWLLLGHNWAGIWAVGLVKMGLGP